MKIIVLTQEDSFSVPRNIEKVIKLNFTEVLMIVNICSDSSLENKKTLFIKGFGLIQSLKMAYTLAIHKLANLLNAIFNYELSFQLRSLKSVSKKYKIPYQVINNPNDSNFLNLLESLQPDIIISYSAPVIFREQLLKLPQKGCINLHCSLLPNYAGLMPSFWTLYKNEKITGCTIHYMDSKIDNGKILAQRKVEIEANDSITDIIIKTKEIGGELMCSVLKDIKESNVTLKDNDVSKGSYYKWPTVNDFKLFRKNGGKLI